MSLGFYMTAIKRKTNGNECVFKRLIDKEQKKKKNDKEISACSYVHTQEICLIERKMKKFKDGKEK